MFIWFVQGSILVCLILIHVYLYDPNKNIHHCLKSTVLAMVFFNFVQVEMRVEVEKSENEQEAAFLSQLRGLGVDMTKYLVALQPEFVPEKEVIVGPATREIQSGATSVF